MLPSKTKRISPHCFRYSLALIISSMTSGQKMTEETRTMYYNIRYLNNIDISTGGFIKFNPNRAVITRFFPSAYMTINACGSEARREFRTKQKMIDS